MDQKVSFGGVYYILCVPGLIQGWGRKVSAKCDLCFDVNQGKEVS